MAAKHTHTAAEGTIVTIDEAKAVLSIYRPGVDEIDPAVAEALALSQRDDDLKQWFEQHRAVQEALRSKLRDLSPPPHLKHALLAKRSTLKPQFRPAPWLAAAAALALIAVVALLLRQPEAGRFSDYRERVVRKAIREYVMDIKTDNLAEVNHYLSTNGAPATYQVPPGLSKASLTGAGVLRWQNHPVSMLCYDRGDSNMLFLFVLSSQAVKDAPPSEPALTNISRMVAASWTTHTNTYILAGLPEEDFIQKYLTPP